MTQDLGRTGTWQRVIKRDDPEREGFCSTTQIVLFILHPSSFTFPHASFIPHPSTFRHAAVGRLLAPSFFFKSGKTFSTRASAVMPCFLRRIGMVPCSMNWSGQPM